MIEGGENLVCNLSKLITIIRNVLNNGVLIVKDIVINENQTINISIKEVYPLFILEGEPESSVSGILPFSENNELLCRFCFNEKFIGYPNVTAA